LWQGEPVLVKQLSLNLMLQEIPTKERIITIEDTRELQFNLPNVVRLEASPPVGDLKGLTIRDLLKNTLRMRPDRIVVGECRGGEVFDLLQAMNTGHEGSMTSVHANSPGECLLRLENLYMLSGYDLPIKPFVIRSVLRLISSCRSVVIKTATVLFIR
jgi:pilus assembly protein CpaF